MTSQYFSGSFRVFRRLSSGVLMMLIVIPVSAQEPAAVFGDWISKGQQEKRELSLKQDNTGLFISTHSTGICQAPLKVSYDGQFVEANGLAENCQKRGNAVAFSFICQHAKAKLLHCKIRSMHVASGNSKEGVETFER